MASRIQGITVEIGGDTTKLSKALESVNKSIKGTQSGLKDVNKLLKLDPSNTELVVQKQKMLKDAIEATKEKLATLKTAAQQANEQLANGEITQQQYDALQREIVETEQNLRSLQDQAATTNATLAKIDEAGEKLQNIGSSVENVGKKFLPVTAAVTGLGTAAVKTAADFDSEMSKVSAISGATGDDFDQLRAKAREMGAKTKFSASEAASAMEYMAMAGWKTSDMLNGIEGIMNLAAASGEDLATTSDIVTDALTAFGLSAADSGHFADILAAASSNANTNVSMMGETFKYCAPIAGALGFSAEDTAEAIGLMANSGIKASQAGTSLRTIMNNLSGEVTFVGKNIGEVTIATSNADGSMRSLNDILADCRVAFSGLSESEKAANAEALVGKNAMSGFLALMNSSETDINKLRGAIENCDGASESMAETMQDNLNGQLTILKSQLEELAISFGDILMPTIRKIVSAVQQFVDKLNSMDESTRETIIKIGLLAASIGPLLIVLGKTISTVGTAMRGFSSLAKGVRLLITHVGSASGVFSKLGVVLGGLSGPVVAVVAVIGTLVAAFMNLWNTNEEFRTAITGIWNDIVSKVKGFCDQLTQRINGLGFDFKDVTEVLRAVWDGQFGYMSGRDDYNNVVCYDMDRKFLGGCFRAENGKIYDNYVVMLLPNTRFISVTTNEKLFSKLSVYLYDNMLPLRLLSNYATGWQWMNGSVDIRFTGSKVTVTFPEGKDVYVCRRTNGTQYEQTKLRAENSTSVDFAAKGWWAIYYDGMEVSADETGEKIELPVIKAENTGGDWGGLFTRNRFVFAVLYQSNVVYAAPSNSGTVINGIDYGNPAKIAYNAITWHKYRSAKMFLATGQFAIDTVNRTIQVTKRILAVVDNGAYCWISASEEPVPMLDSTEAEKHHMLILAYDSSIDQINLYNTAQFRTLGINGYYIAAWYENHFWYPHMGSSFSIVLDGTTYKAGELFDEERRDSYIEKKYEDRFRQLRTDLAGKDSRHMYLASGGITIDQNAGTIQVSTKCLGVPDTFHYEWITAGDPVEMAFNTPNSTFGMPMRILAYDAGTKTINLYDTSLFRKLGTNGFYIASWYQSKLYNPHIHPDVKFIVGGKEYKAGDLFIDNAASFIPKRITDYVQKAITPAVEDDIVTPSHWDCMEGRQLSIFFDCLSRHDGKENLYVLARGTNAPSLTRNEYCMNYTPTKDSTDFALTVRRLDEDDCHTVSSKPVQVRVHHKLKDKLTKNICICGDSLVDNGSVATEVYRLLAEDNDCVIHPLGTRGPEGGKHEGRGSWTFARYLADTDYAGKTNAFWDKIKGRLDFQKYCETNGYEGIDYFLIALGTNDVSQGTTLYRTEAEVQKFVDQAKQFIDALLDKETGFPNCKIGIGLCGPGSDYSYQCGSSMGIFHMSINTLNLALIKAFDAGKYHKNVTCFAHGLRTDRRLAFPYSDKPVTNRFTETSRTLTNSIHPSGRGYQAWADGYYCQIRAWLTEDSK